MKYKNRLFLIILFFFYLPISYSQQKVIDSLNVVLKDRQIDDADKLKAMIRLTKCYVDEDNEEAYMLSDNALSFARVQANDELKLSAYVNKALTLEMIDSIQASYYIMDTCFQFIDKLGNVAAKAEALMNLAGIKQRYREEADILPMIFEALDIARKINDKELQVKIYYFLSNIYYAPLGDTENMSKYAELGYVTAKDITDADIKILPYLSKGFLYRNKFIADRSNQAYLDTSIVFLKQCIDICDANKGYIASNKELNFIGHLTSTYTFETYNRNDSTFYVHPDSVYKYANLMLQKAEEAESPYYIVGAYRFLSGYESNRKRFDKAEEILVKALDILGNNDKYLQMKHLLYLSLVYQLRISEKYEQALEYMEGAYEYQEKLYRKKYIREGQVTEAKYRLKENEKQLQLSKQEAERKNRLLIGSVLSAILLIFILFVFYQMRLKNIRQKVQIHEKEKEEIRLHALIKEKELQRSESERKTLKLEKELEEERAERQALEINRLQTELIAGISQLDQKSDTIEKIKQQLNTSGQSNNEEIKELLLTDKMADRSFEDFAELVQKVHPGFYAKLQKKAIQKLTPLDFRYCTYIFMDFTSKEIANIMHVDPNTVRTTKYRLKLKLDLGKDEDLASFIKDTVNHQL